MPMHACYKSLCISLLSSAQQQQREMTKFYVFRKTRTTDDNFLYFNFELNPGATYLAWASCETNRRTEQI